MRVNGNSELYFGAERVPFVARCVGINRVIETFVVFRQLATINYDAIYNGSGPTNCAGHRVITKSS